MANHCVTMFVKFGTSATKDLICINGKELQKWRSAGTSPPWGGGVADQLKKPPPGMCYHVAILN